MTSKKKIMACRENWKKAITVMKARPLQRVECVCAHCGTPYQVEPYRAKKTRFCSFHCRQVGVSRETRTIRSNILRDQGAGKTYRKLMGRHEHRVIAEQKIGRPLDPNEIVHHVNGNIRDNRPENLEVMKSQAVHARYHWPMMHAARQRARRQ